MDLIRLTTRFGKRYAPTIALVIVLQLVTTLATLYLPDLNADIINIRVIGIPARVGNSATSRALLRIGFRISNPRSATITQPGGTCTK